MLVFFSFRFFFFFFLVLCFCLGEIYHRMCKFAIPLVMSEMYKYYSFHRLHLILTCLAMTRGLLY